MSKRWLNNFCAVCVVILFFVVLLVTAGCGGGKGLKIDVQVDGTDKKVTLETDYQIENGLKITRNIKTGEYEIVLGSATTKDAETGLLSQVFGMMQMMMYQNMGIPMPVPQATPVPDADGADLFKAGVEEGMRRQTELFNRSDRE